MYTVGNHFRLHVDKVSHAANTCEPLAVRTTSLTLSCLPDLLTASALLLPHPSPSLPSALPPCSLSPSLPVGWAELVMRGPLCPCLPVLCPMVHGALLGQVPDRLDPLFAHYSHYLASNQCRAGCWDLSTTHKGPSSLAGLPTSDPIRKMEVQYRRPDRVLESYFAYSNRWHRNQVWFKWCCWKKGIFPTSECSCWMAGIFKKSCTNTVVQ